MQHKYFNYNLEDGIYDLVDNCTNTINHNDNFELSSSLKNNRNIFAKYIVQFSRSLHNVILTESLTQPKKESLLTLLTSLDLSFYDPLVNKRASLLTDSSLDLFSRIKWTHHELTKIHTSFPNMLSACRISITKTLLILEIH